MDPIFLRLLRAQSWRLTLKNNIYYVEFLDKDDTVILDFDKGVDTKGLYSVPDHVYALSYPNSYIAEMFTSHLTRTQPAELTDGMSGLLIRMLRHYPKPKDTGFEYEDETGKYNYGFNERKLSEIRANKEDYHFILISYSPANHWSVHGSYAELDAAILDGMSHWPDSTSQTWLTTFECVEVGPDSSNRLKCIAKILPIPKNQYIADGVAL